MRFTSKAASALLLAVSPALSYAQNSVSPEDEKAIKQAIIHELTDPDSAKFREIRISADGNTACGYVNAKNKFGGYTGFKIFQGAIIRTPNYPTRFAPISISNSEIEEQANLIVCHKNGVLR
ncbi:hypothetical protein L0Z13_15215 [Burkholderia multivorans]|uniref:hypothetical protein n=1 Tax=Burkholderia TaxID=32008 RepID=UPI000CFF040C|nr:hypothetical protein [Burkholderia multivorans]AVR21430.1 hypothetical protein A8H40_18485 [Burkholderia multivorans]MBY4791140.1 hypothetical protein [Burkholderia multivorans]MCO1434763.1 hypothetical protein [Burkholderia multivorans]PRD82563.1 hypothetical protein C6P74_03950 [Burkholderia multivorans]PRE61130.1 hypothetical protein C6P86_21255 [Burkholderia multivorans]